MHKHQGSIIKKRIDESGISVKEIARRIGVSRGGMYLIFDRASVDAKTMLKIGHAIGHDFADDFQDMTGKAIVMEDVVEYGTNPESVLKRLEKELAACKAKCFDLMEENNLLLEGRLREYFQRKPLNAMELHPKYTPLNLSSGK